MAKHFLDDPARAVEESLLGLACASNGHEVRLLAGFPDTKVVVSAAWADTPADERGVALVSGGGSGHEPGQIGYVGRGMLAAAVCGDVFASPSAEAVYWAIKAVAGPAGCLLIVMNYTGDRLNFGLAAERAKREGLKVDMVVVGEDVALPRKKTGRRGLAGTVLVHKVCGAAAARGAPLDRVRRLAERTCARLGTMGVSLTCCNIPGQAGASDQRLAADEMEVGLGIHGEPGREKKKVAGARAVVKEVVDTIARSGGNEYFACERGEEVALMVNNLGAVTPIELSLLAHKALEYCRADEDGPKLRVKRLLVGSFKTSLDMVGVSITLMKTGKHIGVGDDGDAAADSFDDLLDLIDAETDAPGWPKFTGREPGAASACFLEVDRSGGGGSSSTRPLRGEAERASASAGLGQLALSQEEQTVAATVIATACDALVKCQKLADDLDRKIGDGDCGSTMKKGAEGILKDQLAYDLTRGSAIAAGLAESVMKHMGGTSGAIYNILFTAASTHLQALEESPEKIAAGTTKYMAFVEALRAGVAAVQKYGGAQVGDRTLIDVLHPFAHSLDPGAASVTADLSKALKVAQVGAEGTKDMKEAILGRSSYVPADALIGIGDPGAVVALHWLVGMVVACRMIDEQRVDALERQDEAMQQGLLDEESHLPSGAAGFPHPSSSASSQEDGANGAAGADGQNLSNTNTANAATNAALANLQLNPLAQEFVPTGVPAAEGGTAPSSSPPYVGSHISLIYRSDIRYEGTLYTIDTQKNEIALKDVRSFGTEGRKDGIQIEARAEVYDYDFIIFKGSDIKNLRVLD